MNLEYLVETTRAAKASTVFALDSRGEADLRKFA